MPGDYLAHHGIRGQKWGVRRYQNEDGSYTNAGRERHAEAESSDNGSSPSNNASRNAKIKRGAMIVGGIALTAIAAYALYKTGAGKQMLDAGKNVFNKMPAKTKVSDVSKITKASSAHKDSIEIAKATAKLSKKQSTKKDVTNMGREIAKNMLMQMANNAFTSSQQQSNPQLPPAQQRPTQQQRSRQQRSTQQQQRSRQQRPSQQRPPTRYYQNTSRARNASASLDSSANNYMNFTNDLLKQFGY